MSDKNVSRRDFLKSTSALAVGASIGLSGCIGPNATTITLSATGLPGLPQGTYQGWAVLEDGTKIPADYQDALVNGEQHQYELPQEAADATSVAVTVEPEGDNNDQPSGVVVMRGSLNDNNTADLSFPVDLTQASGGYTMATPSNGSGQETSGVWFIEKTGSKPPSPALNVPELPSGWVYEGWVKLPNKPPVTTGRFRDPTEPDFYGGFSGDQGVPPRPGEDLLNKTDRAPDGVSFPVDLTAQQTKVVLSVEPDMGGTTREDGTYTQGTDIGGLAKPFPVKPLVGTVLEGATSDTLYQLNLNSESLPSGTAQIENQSGGY